MSGDAIAADIPTPTRIACEGGHELFVRDDVRSRVLVSNDGL